MSNMPNVKITEPLSDYQIWEITENLDCIEEFAGDPYRIRFVFKDGIASHWFSRLWNKITWDHIKPVTPLRRQGE